MSLETVKVFATVIFGRPVPDRTVDAAAATRHHGSPPCSSATSQQYFSLGTNQPLATSQQYSSIRTNQHQPSATSQPNRLHGSITQSTAALIAAPLLPSFLFGLVAWHITPLLLRRSHLEQASYLSYLV
jgi:hypothetical protein